MSHIVKLGSAAIVGMQFLTGMATTQTDPGVQTASRAQAQPSSIRRMTQMDSSLNNGLKRFQDVDPVSGGPSGNNSHRRGTVSSRSRR